MAALKQKLVLSIARFLYGTGLLSLINRWVNDFKLVVGSHGELVFPFVRRRRCRNLQILLYHRVNDLLDPFFCGMPTAVFDRQMGYLAEHFTPCSLETALDDLDKNDIPPNAVVVTFDDGYRDNFTHAFPILSKYGVPATIFLATGSINDGPTLWFDRVFQAFRETKVEVLAGYGTPKQDFPLYTQIQRVEAQTKVLGFLRSLSDQEKFAWLNILYERLKVEECVECPGLMLRWGEVREMARNGISLGAHTVHHPILSRISPQKVRDEILLSKQVIEREVGMPVVTFAYPNGTAEDFDGSAKLVLKEAGFRCAVTTIPGTNDSERDRLELRRGTPWDHDMAMFALRLNHYKLAS